MDEHDIKAQEWLDAHPNPVSYQEEVIKETKKSSGKKEKVEE